MRQRGKLLLIGALDGAPFGAKDFILGERFEQFQLFEILDPSAADRLADQRGKARIGQRHPSSRRHAVGLIAELLRPQRMKVLQHVLLQQFRMKFCDAVDGVAADTGEMRHAHVALTMLVD
jgi:hypothetical protein